jgi:hypothetical protein
MTTIEAEQKAGVLLDDLGFPRDEWAAENVLAAIRLEVLVLANAEEERRLLGASIVAGRSGLVAAEIELVA